MIVKTDGDSCGFMGEKSSASRSVEAITRLQSPKELMSISCLLQNKWRWRLQPQLFLGISIP
jgi:hypothetical protein